MGRNPELMFPIKLGGGTLCQAQALEACVEGEFDASDVCCTELFREDSDGPEELISWVMCLAYVGIIPGEDIRSKQVSWCFRILLFCLNPERSHSVGCMLVAEAMEKSSIV